MFKGDIMKNISLQDFETIVAALERNVAYYEKSLEANKFSMSLANGEYINIAIPKSCIGHLLGIKIDDLRASGIIRKDTYIYDVIKKIINSEITYQSLKNKNYDPGRLFSDYIEKKLEIFVDIVKIRTDDLECIIKYSSDRTYTTGDYAITGDYFIIRKHDAELYSALGLIFDKNIKKYVPNTSRLFNSREELDQFLSTLRNQEVTYPTSFTVDNYDQGYHKIFYSYLDSKLIWCKKMKNISHKFGLIPVNNNDIIFIIEKFMNTNRDNSNNISVITSILENIKSGSIIEKNYLMESLGIRYISDEIAELIDYINDHLYSNTSIEISPEYSFTELTNRINELEQQKNGYKTELEKAQDELRKAQEEIESLKQQLEISEQCLSIYSDASAKVLSLRKQNNGLTKNLLLK